MNTDDSGRSSVPADAMGSSPDPNRDRDRDRDRNPDPDPDPDPEAVRRSIRERGEEIKREELRQAFDRLEADRTLTDRQRQIIAGMATAIVEGVLRVPDAALADVPEHDRSTVRTAIELFDPDR